MNISRNAMIIMAVLLVAIALAYFTSPKPHPMRAPSDVAGVQGRDASMDAEGILQQPSMQVSPGGEEAPAAPVAPPPAAAAISLPPAQGSDLDLLQERYGRDNPFAPLYSVSEAPAKVSNTPVTFAEFPELRPVLTPVSPPPNFNLTAVAVSKGHGIAVIDGEILREGDEIKDYTVVSIKQDQVVLQGKFGEKFVLKLKQDLRGVFNDKKNEITNINVMKAPARSFNGPASNTNGGYLPGPLPALQDYSIPGPDDFKTEPLPPSGSLP